jgi:hypothetical protein
LLLSSIFLYHVRTLEAEPARYGTPFSQVPDRRDVALYQEAFEQRPVGQQQISRTLERDHGRIEKRTKRELLLGR